MKPDFWLHQIHWELDELAGACAGNCIQSVTFSTKKNLGTEGIEIAFESKSVTFSIKAPVRLSDRRLAKVSLNVATNEVEATVESKDPLELSVTPAIYKMQPDYWLHLIEWKLDKLAGACSGKCTQSAKFSAEKHMGKKGVHVEFEGFVVKLGVEPLRHE